MNKPYIARYLIYKNLKNVDFEYPFKVINLFKALYIYLCPAIKKSIESSNQIKNL